MNTINREIRVLEHWLKVNSLFINVVKTEAMLFGTSQKLSKVDDFSIFLSGSLIKRVMEFKYLGVTFDQRLSWNEHIDSLISKAGKRIGLLGRLRRVLACHSANVIYLSMIRPTLEYCSGVWGCCGEVNSNKLETLQRRAGRVVVRTCNSKLAMEALKWEDLKTRRDDNIANLVKKCIKGHCPQFFKNYFTYNRTVSGRSTRQANKLHPPLVRTEVAKRSFYYHGCTIFNNTL